MNKSDWNLQKRINSFGYAFKGIAALFSQPNACIHAYVAVGVIICGCLLKLECWEWCAVSICIGGVLMAEAFNTALESLADRVSPDFDKMVGRAKDLAAGGVLLFVFASVAVGLIIFLPKLLQLFWC